MAKKESSPRKPRKRAAAAPRRRAVKPKALALPAAPRLDYPQEGERISSAEYTLRIDAPQNGAAVEVSIDQGPWQACRSSVGFWWFDWTGFAPGQHVLLARLVDEGRAAVSSERRCVVEP